MVPEEGDMTVIHNEKNDLIPTRTVTGWHMCVDYRKLNDATRKDHFPLPFMDQMLIMLPRMMEALFQYIFIVSHALNPLEKNAYIILDCHFR